MNTQPHTLPCAIGGRVTLPGGTVIEILGIHNGHVGLAVIEATAPPAAAKPKPKRITRRKGPWLCAVDDPLYWQEYDKRRRSNASRWKRLYKTLADWLAQTPDGMAGHARAPGDPGFWCAPPPNPFLQRKAYIRPENRKD